MRRLIALAMFFAACIPEPVRAQPCSLYARRCTPTGQPAICVAGEWGPDTTSDALTCAR